MKIFNVGIREILFLLAVMLILFGPRQLQENARKTAQVIRRFTRSEVWKSFLGIYSDVNEIKNEMVRESGIMEIRDSLHEIGDGLNDLSVEMKQSLPAGPSDSKEGYS